VIGVNDCDVVISSLTFDLSASATSMDNLKRNKFDSSLYSVEDNDNV